MLKLFGANVSPFVRKTRVFLAEKGLSYEYEQLSPFPPSEKLRQLSPLGRIPAFQDGDKTLADSSIICAYLENTHPQPALYPSDPYDYARALYFEEYGDGGLAPIIGPKIFFNKIVGPLLMKRPVDEELAKTAVEKDLPPMFDYLESKVTGDFLVGDKLTIGDIGIATSFVNFKHAGYKVDAGRWPKLAAYIGQIHSRPSFKTVIDEEVNTYHFQH
jgi:glutathione S-transferase